MFPAKKGSKRANIETSEADQGCGKEGQHGGQG